MAKFKVGDKVKVKNPPHHTSDEVGVIKGISGTGRPGDPVMAEVHYGEGATWGNYGVIYASPSIMRLANSVRGNTKLKNIDYWFADNGYGDDTLIKYVQSYKKNKCIDFVDRYADTAARDAFYDAMYELTGVKSRWALNSRACNASAKIVTTGNFGTLKVGDRVDFRKSRYWRGTGVVTKVYGDGIIDVKGDNGEGEMEIHEEDIMNSRVRSCNSVVAKALNSKVAMNADTKKMVADAYGRFIQAAWVDCKEQHSERMAAYQKLESLCNKALVGYWKETGRY